MKFTLRSLLALCLISTFGLTQMSYGLAPTTYFNNDNEALGGKAPLSQSAETNQDVENLIAITFPKAIITSTQKVLPNDADQIAAKHQNYQIIDKYIVQVKLDNRDATELSKEVLFVFNHNTTRSEYVLANNFGGSDLTLDGYPGYSERMRAYTVPWLKKQYGVDIQIGLNDGRAWSCALNCLQFLVHMQTGYKMSIRDYITLFEKLFSEPENKGIWQGVINYTGAQQNNPVDLLKSDKFAVSGVQLLLLMNAFAPPGSSIGTKRDNDPSIMDVNELFQHDFSAKPLIVRKGFYGYALIEVDSQFYLLDPHNYSDSPNYKAVKVFDDKTSAIVQLINDTPGTFTAAYPISNQVAHKIAEQSRDLYMQDSDTVDEKASTSCLMKVNVAHYQNRYTLRGEHFKFPELPLIQIQANSFEDLKRFFGANRSGDQFEIKFKSRHIQTAEDFERLFSQENHLFEDGDTLEIYLASNKNQLDLNRFLQPLRSA